jgi:hypothetical protein
MKIEMTESHVLEIREILGDCINETITIEKYKIPMTKEKLQKRFVRLC